MSDDRAAKEFVKEGINFPLEDINKRLRALEASEGIPPTFYILIIDQKATGTAGGAFNNGAWRTRDLTTEVTDDEGLAAVAANQITLQPGKYVYKISAPAYRVDGHKVRLQNITAGATTAYGTTEYASAADNVQTRSYVQGQLEITVATVFEVQHRCITTRAADGFGFASAGLNAETYTTVEFWTMV